MSVLQVYIKFIDPELVTILLNPLIVTSGPSRRGARGAIWPAPCTFEGPHFASASRYYYFIVFVWL